MGVRLVWDRCEISLGWVYLVWDWCGVNLGMGVGWVWDCFRMSFGIGLGWVWVEFGIGLGWVWDNWFGMGVGMSWSAKWKKSSSKYLAPSELLQDGWRTIPGSTSWIGLREPKWPKLASKLKLLFWRIYSIKHIHIVSSTKLFLHRLNDLNKEKNTLYEKGCVQTFNWQQITQKWFYIQPKTAFLLHHPKKSC